MVMVVKCWWWAGQAEPDLVEVVGELAGDGAVEPGLEVGGPVLVQDVLAAGVLLADPGHPRVDGLAAVHVLSRHLAEEEVDVVADLVGADKVGLVQHVGVVLDGPLETVLAPAAVQVEEVGPEDDCVGLGELSVGAGVEGGQAARVATLDPDGGGVVLGVEGTLRDAAADAGDVLVDVLCSCWRRQPGLWGCGRWCRTRTAARRHRWAGSP